MLPKIDSFSRTSQQETQAKGWCESLVAIGDKLHATGKLPTEAQKQTIKSIAQSLETVNPTSNPASSSLMGGQWRLVFSDSPGVSSGKVGPFWTGRVYQDVDLAEKLYYNILEVGAKEKPWLKACLKATWKEVDASTWEVEFEDITIDVFGKSYVRQFNNVKRYWQISYLSSTVRIMRGRRPERKEEDAFLFVLQKDNGEGR